MKRTMPSATMGMSTTRRPMRSPATSSPVRMPTTPGTCMALRVSMLLMRP